MYVSPAVGAEYEMGPDALLTEILVGAAVAFVAAIAYIAGTYVGQQLAGGGGGGGGGGDAD